MFSMFSGNNVPAKEFKEPMAAASKSEAEMIKKYKLMITGQKKIAVALKRDQELAKKRDERHSFSFNKRGRSKLLEDIANYEKSLIASKMLTSIPEKYASLRMKLAKNMNKLMTFVEQEAQSISMPKNANYSRNSRRMEITNSINDITSEFEEFTKMTLGVFPKADAAVQQIQKNAEPAIAAAKAAEGSPANSSNAATTGGAKRRRIVKRRVTKKRTTKKRTTKKRTTKKRTTKKRITKKRRSTRRRA